MPPKRLQGIWKWSLRWGIPGLVAGLLLMLWYLQAGFILAGLAALAAIYATMIYVFYKVQWEARSSAVEQFNTAASSLRERLERMESKLQTKEGKQQQASKEGTQEAVSKLREELETLRSSVNEIAARPETEEVSAGDALETEKSRLREEWQGELGNLKEALNREKKERDNAIGEALEAEKEKRNASIQATYDELLNRLESEKEKQAEALEEAIEAESDRRSNAIRALSEELYESLEQARGGGGRSAPAPEEEGELGSGIEIPPESEEIEPVYQEEDWEKPSEEHPSAAEEFELTPGKETEKAERPHNTQGEGQEKPSEQQGAGAGGETGGKSTPTSKKQPDGQSTKKTKTKAKKKSKAKKKGHSKKKKKGK